MLFLLVGNNSMRNKILGLFISVLLIFILLLRAHIGLDFLDEMQYYGEISSLIHHLKLFQVDFFVQQFCYLFFSPFYFLFKQFSYNMNYLILFNRYVFSSLLITLYVICFYRFKSIKLNNSESFFLSFLITLGIIYKAIFSISYNTLISVLIVLYIIFSFEKKVNKNLNIFYFIISFSVYVYPPIGIFLFFFFILTENEIDRFKFTLNLILLNGIFIGIMLALNVFDYRIIIDSYLKSSRLLVAKSFFDGHYYLKLLFYLLIIDVYLNFYLKNELKTRLTGIILILAISLVFIFYALEYLNKVEIIPVLIYLLLVNLLFQKSNFLFRVFLKKQFLLFGSLIFIFSLVSSGGHTKMGNIALLFIPFLYPVYLKGSDLKIKPVFKFITGFYLFAIIFFNSLYIYGDVPIYKLKYYEKNHNWFKGLYLSPAKYSLIKIFNYDLKMKLKGQKLTVIGPSPWIYSTLNSLPLTPMYYMHYSGNNEFQMDILKEIDSLDADYIMVTQDENFSSTFRDYLECHILKKYNLYRSIQIDDKLVNDYYEETQFKIVSPYTLYEKM